MAQHARCLSDTFAGKDVVDSSFYRFGPDRSPPTKRVRRLLHDPTRVQPMERVFSEYDWRTDKFAPTLRVVSDAPSSSSSFVPPRRSKSAISHTHPRNDVEPARQGDIIPVHNTSISRVNPSALQRVPDAARLSSFLLTSEEETGNMGHGPIPSALYPTSPISRGEESFSAASSSAHWSPLQQFVASCETPEDDLASLRIPKRRRDAVRTRTPRGARRVLAVDSSVGSERTIVTGRRRANTWDSDTTVFNPVEEVSSSGNKGKSVLVPSPRLELPVASSFVSGPSADLPDDRNDLQLMDIDGLGPERDADMSESDAAPCAATQQHAPDLWTVWESEERTPTPSLAGPSRTRRTRRKQQRMTLLRKRQSSGIDEENPFSTAFDAPSSSSILLVDSEDDTSPTPSGTKKKASSPIATFASAVRLRYVSLCMRIQLDAFRMEKKVKRRLRDPWMKSPPPPLAGGVRT